MKMNEPRWAGAIRRHFEARGFEVAFPESSPDMDAVQVRLSRGKSVLAKIFTATEIVSRPAEYFLDELAASWSLSKIVEGLKE